MSVCDIKLPPLPRIELRYSGILTSRRAAILYRRFGTAYGFHILFLDLTLEYGENRLPRNVGTELPVCPA